ncbi:uncharacterized protein LOC117502778 [Thalassophryne amazonica]|uniref:uncharacterized protein LOC117502778 n=1 Tax=Thalassophryne amazonica TaxID=390379 RepID=UPI0014724286|nr:uncharacterized protein LOC117502778 [Thalassophryne amazonica]
MDKITQEHICQQIVKGVDSPPSPKRPRTDYMMLLYKTTSSLSSINTVHKNKAENRSGDLHCENQQPQENKFSVIPHTKMTPPHTDDAPTGASKVCCILPERHSPDVGKDKQSAGTESDKLSSSPAQHPGGTLAETYTSKHFDTDYKRLDTSPEDETLGGHSPLCSSDEDGQLQAVNVSLSVEESLFQPGSSTCEHVTRFCKKRSQSSNTEENNDNRNKYSDRKNVLFDKEEKECSCNISCSHNEDSKSCRSVLDTQMKSGEKMSDLQICGKGNFTFCNVKSKEQVNQKRTNANPANTECAEEQIVSSETRNVEIVTEIRVIPEIDNLCGEEGENAALQMITKPPSEMGDYTTETPVPAQISQEPAEGDNDAGPFSVIDPAIWSETDREAEGSTAGVELSPSVKICEVEMPVPLCSDVRDLQHSTKELAASDQAEQFNGEGRAQQATVLYHLN